MDRNKKSSFSMLLVLILMFTLVMSACGNKDKDEGGGTAKSGLKVGLVTDTGGVNDKSFNQSAWEGLQQVKKDSGITIQYLESKGDADYIPNLNQYAKNGYDLTWGIGYMMAESIQKVAKDNSSAKLAIIDNEVKESNVASVMFAEHEGSFLVGIVAAMMTKTNKIGFVGGMNIPVIKRFEAGFKAGVAAINPQLKVETNYVGDFNKPDGGKAAAATLYNNGADIIFSVAGNTGNGVFNEAKGRSKGDKKVWVIGVDKDQSIEFGNEITLTSMMKRVDQAVEKVTTDLVNGAFPGGTVVTLGLKDKGVGLPEKNVNVPEDVMDKVKEYEQKIVSGEVKVPDTVK